MGALLATRNDEVALCSLCVLPRLGYCRLSTNERIVADLRRQIRPSAVNCVAEDAVTLGATVSHGYVPTNLPDDLSPRFDRACRALTELVLGRRSENVVEILKDIIPTLGLKNIAHLRFAPNKSDEVALLSAVVTYSKDWQFRYFTRRYHEIDPVVQVGRTATAPFDWRDIRGTSPTASAFFEDATEHGVGACGVTIPVRNRPKGIALVSISSDLSDGKWEAYKLNHMVQLELMTALIDSAAQIKTRLPFTHIELSRREEQALTWAARGKTSSEIADIMQVSYASVRTYLESARSKLCCANLTHTAASAVAVGLIPAQALKGMDPRGFSERDEHEEQDRATRAPEAELSANGPHDLPGSAFD
jgi:DNA-binding CsgD family transcriptional regulator